MKTLLVIDDEPDCRAVLAQMLEVAGWRVLQAADGAIGLELALLHRPSIVICDLLMPRFNGFQTCRAIRERRELDHTKIVITTGRGYSFDRKNSLEAGANEYLEKPIDTQELMNILERFERETPHAGPPVTGHSQPPTDRSLRLRFWGVRGSIPTPGPSTVGYGGNTSCVEVRVNGEIIVLDAGTGIRLLGLALIAEFKDQPISLTLLITHTHWDHIQGFPFFPPAYNPKNNLRILGYEGSRVGLEATLTGQMESSYFPISLGQMQGNITFHELKEMEFKIEDVTVRAAFVNHPGICVGYRITTQAGVIVYMPDNESYYRMKSVMLADAKGDPKAALNYARKRDQELIEFARGADVLIMDSQYEVAEYPAKVGWGHSCVDDAVAFALSAQIKHLYLFHHDPGHNDEKIAGMVAHARELVAAQGGSVTVDAAREGLEHVLKPLAAAGG